MRHFITLRETNGSRVAIPIEFIVAVSSNGDAADTCNIQWSSYDAHFSAEIKESFEEVVSEIRRIQEEK